MVLVAIHHAFVAFGFSSNNNPLEVEFKEDDSKFYPYYVVKDLFGIIIFLMFYSAFVFFASDYLSLS